MTLFEKAIAFVYEAIIAATLGTSIITDAYFTAAELFSLLDGIFLSSLTVVALNRFSAYLNIDDKAGAFKILSNLFSCYLPIVTAVAGGIFIFARPISYIIAPGYDSMARLVLIRSIKVFCIVPIIMCFASIELAILQYKRHFLVIGLKSLFISVAGIISLLFFVRDEVNNADVLSVAYVISIILYCLVISFNVSQYGRIHLQKPSYNPEIINTLKMIFPLMVSYGITNVSLMIGKIIASTLGEGYVSAMTYAHSLYRVVASVFITNLTLILLTDFNELFSKKKFAEASQKIRKVASVMTLFLLPITIITIICCNDIVKIVYQRGSFTTESTKLVGSALAMYALSFIPAMLHGIYNQVLYANGNTKKPMWIAIISIVSNIVVSVVMTRFIGLSGIAFGTFISSVASVVLSDQVVKTECPSFDNCYTMQFIIKCIGAGIGSGVCVFGIKALELPAILSFGISTIVGSACFLAALILLKETIVIDLLESTVGYVKRRITKV